MSYIQLKTGIYSASVKSVNGKEKVIYIGEDATHATYMSPKRAKDIAFALLKAAAQAERAKAAQ